jgi:hypothetical protein
MIDPLCNKNAHDYDDNVDICIEALDDDDVNKKSKLTYNLVLNIEYLCVTKVNKNTFPT